MREVLAYFVFPMTTATIPVTAAKPIQIAMTTTNPQKRNVNISHMRRISCTFHAEVKGIVRARQRGW